MTAMYRRMIQRPNGSFFLFGMRGVGKSTWAQTLACDYQVSLLHEKTYQAYLANPGLFRSELMTQRKTARILVDEIQRLPNLLNEVHALIEERRFQFILLGSSARKLRRAGVNLLGGRAIQKTLYPLIPTELQKDFNLISAMTSGTLPLVVQSDAPAQTLEAYAETYLKEEIQAEAIVRNLPGFARFLPIASLFHGQVLNVETLARDSEVKRTTVNSFIDILVDTMMAERLQPFEERLRVKQRRHPKLYWLDAGVMRAAKRQLGKLALEEQGALFEGLVYQWLRAYKAYGILKYDDITYFSVTGQTSVEVDFILSRGNTHIAIEAKCSQRVREDFYRGLRAIGDLKGVSKRIVVYCGDRSLRTDDGIDVWPWQHFISWLESGGSYDTE